MSGAASDLCRMCGFCCDGTLFGAVRLDDEEAAEPRRRLPILQRDDQGPLIRFPCPAHSGVCSIYEDRPATCRTYRCMLLARLEAEEIDFDSAAARISRIKELILSIEPLLDPGREERLWDRVGRLIERPIAWKQANTERLLEIATLRAMLARFIDPKSG